VAVTNFTWDVIYRDYMDQYSGFASLIEEIRSFYRNASLALALPYSCDLSVFPHVARIPWVTRCSGLTRDQARNAFGLPASAVVVLLSFGGLGLEALPVERLNALTDFFFVTTGPVMGKSGNLVVLDGVQRRYEDLMRAADVVVTKPGYGIVADALAHQVRVLYTDRGQFAEYPFLVQALSELATAEFLPKERFLSGEIGPYLIRLMSKAPNWPAVALNGADRAAERILGLLQ
jgi:L-arabinokinase